jgi:hypothetical protein
MVNLYKLANTQARTSNYEQILRIVNDTLQGSSNNLGFVFGGTPEFMYEPRRGLYSYPALATRLAQNSFATGDRIDFAGPVIKLQNLSKEDFFLLLMRLRHLQAGGDETKYLVPDQALHSFMDHCAKRLGEAYFRTPRTTIVSFLGMLSILEQNPEQSWNDLIDETKVVEDRNPDLDPLGGQAALDETGSSEDDDDLATFRL